MSKDDGDLVCSTLSCSSRYALLSLPHAALTSLSQTASANARTRQLTVRVQPRLQQLSKLWLLPFVSCGVVCASIVSCRVGVFILWGLLLPRNTIGECKN